MLIECVECKAKISDKAYMCPHCGCPTSIRPRKSRGKHRRLPNGFGQISELKGRNLRKPFRAMVTVGKTPEGRPICKILQPEGYFATYNEAYTALLKYQETSGLYVRNITMQELYDEWSVKHFANILPQSRPRLEYAWKFCHSIYDMPVREVRIRHLKACVENSSIVEGEEIVQPKRTTMTNIKNTLAMMFDYAVENELTDKNYARMFNLDKNITKELETDRRNHISFSEKEMEILWANITNPIVDMILIQCYTGFRPSELVSLRKENINLNARIIIAGMKTEAGRNRRVPIHSCIYDLVKKYHDAADDTLFDLSYKQYQVRFEKIMKGLELNPLHRPHDPRKQFTTMAKKYNMDEYAIKLIIGHKISDITESIYTDRDSKWLVEEVEKIKGPEIKANVGNR